MEDKTFLKAFNAGYIIEKYIPALSQLLISNFQNSENDFFEGFIAGSMQCIEERGKKKSRLLTKLKELPKNQSKQDKPKDNKDLDRQK